MDWIKVEDDLPSEVLLDGKPASIYSKEVLAVCDEGIFYLAVYVPKHNAWCQSDKAPEGSLGCITHWMEIPMPEEEEKFQGWDHFAKRSLIDIAKLIVDDELDDAEYGYCHSCIMNSLCYLRDKRIHRKAKEAEKC